MVFISVPYIRWFNNSLSERVRAFVHHADGDELDPEIRSIRSIESIDSCSSRVESRRPIQAESVDRVDCQTVKSRQPIKRDYVDFLQQK